MTQEHDISEMEPDERRAMYGQALNRVGEMGAKAVEDAMKSKLTQKTAGGPGSLRSAFKYFDRDGSGTIDLHEFFKVLEFMGLTFSEDQVGTQPQPHPCCPDETTQGQPRLPMQAVEKGDAEHSVVPYR